MSGLPRDKSTLLNTNTCPSTFREGEPKGSELISQRRVFSFRQRRAIPHVDSQ